MTGIGSEAIEAAGVPWPDDIPVPPLRAYSSPDAFAALIAGAGFAGADGTSAELGAPGRSRAVVGGLPVARGHQRRRDRTAGPATVARIKDEFDRLVARYAVGAGQVALPAVAVLGSGQRTAG